MGTEMETCKILQLSDCTMMYILSYLDATSLFNLSRTCLYFKNIVEEPKLWRYIDARHEPNSTKKVQYVCDQIHDRTSHMLFKAESKYNGLVPQDLLQGWNRLEHLAVLALENQRFDGRSLTLPDFPKTLVELSLKKTYIKNAKLFFQGSYQAMRNLKVLILDECDWLDSNFFMSVAKYENLEILSIIKCMRLHLNVIPYLNVARHGCKKLKLIDCRFNTVGNELLVHSHKSLLALYFQSMSSYQLDTGRPLIKYPPMTSECQDLISQSTIKDRSLEQYKYIIGDLVEELPDSMLYQDPYPECSCGWKDKTDDGPIATPNEETEQNQETHTMPVDDYIDFNLSPQRFICRKHMKELNRLPKDFKQFFYKNQKKFYPDSSDNDSDSDDDRDCCMFGVGKSQQMIVLKIREVDPQGNLPEPEVIDLSRPGRPVINIDVNIRGRQAEQNPRNIDPQPSTSRGNDSSETSRGTMKRKSEDDSEGSDQKRARVDNDVGPSSRYPNRQGHLVRVISSNNQSFELDGSNSSASQSSSGRLTIDNGTNAASSSSGSSRQRGYNREDSNAGPSGASRAPVAQIRHSFRIWPWCGTVMAEEGNQRENKEKIKLRRLSLRGYREITDVGLTSIRNLSLDLLDVTYTGVTKEGIEKFLTLNPNCRVLHPNYCVCKPRIPC